MARESVRFRGFSSTTFTTTTTTTTTTCATPDMTVSVTRMAATSTPGEWGTTPSTGQVSPSHPSPAAAPAHSSAAHFNSTSVHATFTFLFPDSNFVLDTTKPMTVVTQFVTEDGSDSGRLKEIRRQWVQGGKVVANANTNMPGISCCSCSCSCFRC